MRLGEYDTRTTTDGPHEDVRISKVQSHKDFDPDLYLNDIAIISLERNVEFNGKAQISLSLSLPVWSESMLFIFHIYLQIASLQFVYQLPKNS